MAASRSLNNHDPLDYWLIFSRQEKNVFSAARVLAIIVFNAEMSVTAAIFARFTEILNVGDLNSFAHRKKFRNIFFV